MDTLIDQGGYVLEQWNHFEETLKPLIKTFVPFGPLMPPTKNP